MDDLDSPLDFPSKRVHWLLCDVKQPVLKGAATVSVQKLPFLAIHPPILGDFFLEKRGDDATRPSLQLR